MSCHCRWNALLTPVDCSRCTDGSAEEEASSWSQSLEIVRVMIQRQLLLECWWSRWWRSNWWYLSMFLLVRYCATADFLSSRQYHELCGPLKQVRGRSRVFSSTLYSSMHSLTSGYRWFDWSPQLTGSQTKRYHAPEIIRGRSLSTLFSGTIDTDCPIVQHFTSMLVRIPRAVLKVQSDLPRLSQDIKATQSIIVNGEHFLGLAILRILPDG